MITNYDHSKKYIGSIKKEKEAGKLYDYNRILLFGPKVNFLFFNSVKQAKTNFSYAKEELLIIVNTALNMI